MQLVWHRKRPIDSSFLLTIRVKSILVQHTYTHSDTHTRKPFNGYFLGKPALTGFPLDSHTVGFESRSFYRPDALPVAQPMASKHRYDGAPDWVHHAAKMPPKQVRDTVMVGWAALPSGLKGASPVTVTVLLLLLQSDIANGPTHPHPSLVFSRQHCTAVFFKIYMYICGCVKNTMSVRTQSHSVKLCLPAGPYGWLVTVTA